MVVKSSPHGSQVKTPMVAKSSPHVTCWKDLSLTEACRIDIERRCIYELSLAEISGTVLSLYSDNHRSRRFLLGLGESKVLLERKVESCLGILDILCVNQCEGGNRHKLTMDNFYKGGKVEWWNFHFSEQPGKMPFIKRDKFNYIKDTIIPDLLSLKRPSCVFLNLLHEPGCGGTTLAKHMLWELRDKFCCAVLKDTNAVPTEVAQQVVELLTFETT
ncbi:LOW QUALITY PROTEIN: sterile alpha motif domain-containing protein 9-like [Salvelinus alpinus]